MGMKLSTRSRYGLRAMLELALANGTAVTMAKDVAERQNLPVSYLEQLLAQLKRAKLVVSIRGAKGGYSLSRPAEEISLSEIIEALDGPLDVAPCEDIAFCRASPEACVLKEIFFRISEALRREFAAVSLAEFAREQRLREAMYQGDERVQGIVSEIAGGTLEGTGNRE
ncbi:RrF2 family transcriptional regulator [Aminiphilus circumscriptus]|uniref:RrF2 family transcriptional regulator n=1 Tax=Aminiphilus circumscriptus TaxID=290732 RepID=UPI00146FA4F6|nr:Rrf2 family transcriptional regulator [Aminiphilus circumscriptus]